MVRHFANASIRARLEAKRAEFLELTLDAYTSVNSGKKMTPAENKDEDMESAIEDPSTSNGSSQVSAVAVKGAKRKSDKGGVDNTGEEGNAEKWLYHYMLGKIKEKTGSNMVSVMDSLAHYMNSIKYLETTNKATFFKKMTHKTKGNYSFESNEVKC